MDIQLKEILMPAPWSPNPNYQYVYHGHAFDFWMIFGKFDYFAAILPFALILWLITIDSFRKKGENKRLAFVGYSALFMFSVFIIYFFVIGLWKRGIRAYGPGMVSMNYPVLNYACELLILISLCIFIILMVSFYIDDLKVEKIHNLLVRFFPYFILLIVLSNVFLNIRFPAEATYYSRFEGVFTMLFQHFRQTRSILWSPSLFVVVPIAFLISDIFHLHKHKQKIGNLFVMALSAVIVCFLFFMEMFVHWGDNFKPLLRGFDAHHYEYAINLTIMHLVFGLILAQWLITTTFKNQRYEKSGKSIAMGIMVGIIIATLFLHRYWINEYAPYIY